LEVCATADASSVRLHDAVVQRNEALYRAVEPKQVCVYGKREVGKAE